MRAAVFLGEGRLEVQERPEPVADPGELVVEVEACGICGSDVQVLAVPPGHPATPGVVLGHEFVGRVVSHGPGLGRGAEASSTQAPPAASAPAIGSRVVVDPDPKCGVCGPCRAGRPSNCENVVALGVYRDGALARYVAAPVASCHPIADDVPAEIAAMTEPLACVVNATQRAAIRPGETAVVFGAGTIGCLFTAVFATSGAGRIVVVEPSEHRAPVARAVGASEVVTPDEWAAGHRGSMPGGADVVVDAVGAVLPDAIEAAAMGGRVVLFGMNQNARRPVHQVEITEKGLTVMGTYITNFTFPPAIRLIESGLDLRPLLSDVLPLDQVGRGIERIRSGEAVKVVITPT